MDIGVSNGIWVWCPHKSIFPCRTSCAQHQQLVDTDIWPCRSCSCSTRHPHLQSYRESGGHLKVTGYLALEFLLLLPRDLDLSLLSSLDRLLYDDLLDSERSDRERRESAAFAADSFFTSSASCVEENTIKPTPGKKIIPCHKAKHGFWSTSSTKGLINRGNWTHVLNNSNQYKAKQRKKCA